MITHITDLNNVYFFISNLLVDLNFFFVVLFAIIFFKYFLEIFMTFFLIRKCCVLMNFTILQYTVRQIEM